MILDYSRILIVVLIGVRMTGMLVVNPIFGRNNVPNMVNAGLALLLGIILSGTTAITLPEPNLLTFIFWVVKELLLGIVASFILRMFLSALIVGGEIIDMQIGLSMAKAFDPGSNSSISLSSQYLNAMYLVIFFASGSHLTFIQLASQTLEVIPVGTYFLNTDAFYLLPQLFSNILLLGVKLSLPVVVVEIIVTFAVGIIMRIVPQINVFVVNIQFKLLVGILLVILLVPSFSAFMENMITLATENIWGILGEMTTEV